MMVLIYNMVRGMKTADIFYVERPLMDRKAELERIAKANLISLIYLFGSKAQKGLDLLNGAIVGADDQLEDLDLGIVLRDDLPSAEKMPTFYSNLYNQISTLFEPLKLDLVLLQEQHSVFQAEAVYGICIFAESLTIQEEYEEEILRRAADFRPVLEKFYEERLEELAK
jgi:uncharacterized protein